MTIQAKAFLLVAAFLLGLVAGWRVENWHLTSAHEKEKLAQIEVNQQAFAKLLADRDELASKLTASNDKYFKQWRAAQNETNRLRNAGSYGLRVRALCPDSGQSAQGATNASLDTGTGAELAPVARQAYFALRDGIDRTEAKLAACQAELILRQPFRR